MSRKKQMGKIHSQGTLDNRVDEDLDDIISMEPTDDEIIDNFKDYLGE